MNQDIKNRHLTKSDREIIESGIKNGATKTSIADTIGKDNSTVGKEIKQHRILKFKCSLPLECSHYKKCKFERDCKTDCPDFKLFVCKRRDRSPGACNGCSNYSTCRFSKYYYDANLAQQEYEKTLVDSRIGYNITREELIEIGNKIKPLLKNGQSPFVILQNHPEIPLSEKTLYTYIENNVFKPEVDIGPMDLRRQVSRKLAKPKAKVYKKREDRKFLNGRKFEDYQTYKEENPDAKVTQMDTVYNDGSNGPFIQTFKFTDIGFFFAIYHDKTKTMADMTEGVNQLENIIGQKWFRVMVRILLTDRGSEFYDAEGMETDADGSKRTRVFYCDPMASGQKGTLENNHIELRYICIKGVDLRALGLVGQEPLNLVLSHINSMPVEHFGGKSPFEMLEFMYPELYEKFIAFGLRKIPKDEIVLKPSLLRPWKKKKGLSDSTGVTAETAVESSSAANSSADTQMVSDESDTNNSNHEASDSTADISVSNISPVSVGSSKGRKRKQSAISDDEVVRLQKQGLSPKKIAKKMDVSIATYYRRCHGARLR